MVECGGVEVASYDGDAIGCGLAVLPASFIEVECGLGGGRWLVGELKVWRGHNHFLTLGGSEATASWASL